MSNEYKKAFVTLLFEQYPSSLAIHMNDMNEFEIIMLC